MFSIINLSLSLGVRTLFDKANLVLHAGAKYGLVGANGCGKTTFLKILSGEISPTKGEFVKPKQATVGILKQDYYLFETHSIIDVVLMGRKSLWNALCKEQKLLEKPSLSSEDIEELGIVQEKLQQENGYSAESEAAALLEGLGIEGAKHKNSLSTLSGGYKLRVMLAQLLFAKPTLLLLDEPTNYLDIVSIKYLESYIGTIEETVIICSHDRAFLNGACKEILDIDHGLIKAYKGNYDQFEEAKAEELLQRSCALEGINKKQEHLQSFIDRFGAKASKARQAQSKYKAVLKLEEEKQGLNMDASSRRFPDFGLKFAQPSGVVPVEIKSISKSFGEKQVLKNVSFEVHRGDKLGIVGPNGVGKSTLVKILAGKESQDLGEIKWGANIKPAYFPQHSENDVEGFATLLDYLYHHHPTESQQVIRTTLGRVLFSKDDVLKKPGSLSGGEKARLVLAKIMLTGCNFLLVDEPTNHLDLESCESLEEALAEFEGTVIFVSHQRHFISSLATRILELNKEGFFDFKGTYEEYVEKREKDYLIASKAEKQQKPKDKNIPEKTKDKNSSKALREIENLIEKKELELELLLEEIAGHAASGKIASEDHKRLLNKKKELESALSNYYLEWEKLV